VRLAAFAAGLIAIFGVSAGAGQVLGSPGSPAPAATHDSGEHAPAPTHDTGEQAPAPTHDDTGDHATAEEKPAGLPGGLQNNQDGFRLVPVTATLSATETTDFAFRILDEHDEPVTTYTVNHEKELHLIVVRRDLAHYQHVHPVRKADGTWTVPLRAGAPGQYRVFADFVTGGHELTLGADVPAPGDYQPVAVPHPATTAEADGYTVTLEGDWTDPVFTVSRDGQKITTEPYLGARGHLVVLREGDLAYLHVHPTDPDGLAFHAEVPSAGVYRLYLDFQHDGKVHTAEFTADTGHEHK
jgi:hypothetical protein